MLKKTLLLIFLSAILLSLTSCAITMRHDNGKHRGWVRKYDNNHKRKSTVWVVSQDNHKQATKKGKRNSKKKQTKKRWDAKK